MIKECNNDEKRMQSIDAIGTYTFGTSENLVCKKENVKRDNVTKQCLTFIIFQSKT